MLFDEYDEESNRKYINDTYVKKLVDYLRGNMSHGKRRIVHQVETEFKDEA